jgi:hypothetical protein
MVASARRIGQCPLIAAASSTNTRTRSVAPYLGRHGLIDRHDLRWIAEWPANQAGCLLPTVLCRYGRMGGPATIHDMLRRLVGVLLWVMMAHLTIVGSDFSCASHSGDVAAMSQPMTHHRHAMAGSEQVMIDDAPCRMPTTPMCCQALTSCTAVMSVTQNRSFGCVSVDRSSVPRSASDIPRSEILAPDPPPPRV